jgi:hypothetical protein
LGKYFLFFEKDFSIFFYFYFFFYNLIKCFWKLYKLSEIDDVVDYYSSFFIWKSNFDGDLFRLLQLTNDGKYNDLKGPSDDIVSPSNLQEDSLKLT